MSTEKSCRNHRCLKLQGRQSCWRWSQTLSWKVFSSRLIALAWALQLVPAVTELVISELLWLNFSSPEKPVYVYLHSIGSQTPDGQAVGFDTEAYAILDTLAYIRPEIHTLVLGQVRCKYFYSHTPLTRSEDARCRASVVKWLRSTLFSGPKLSHKTT